MGSLDLGTSLDMMLYRSTTLLTHDHERLYCHWDRIGLDLKLEIEVRSG